MGTASPSGRLTTIGSSAASAVNIDFGNAAAQAVGDAVTLRLLPSTAFVSAPTSAPYISAIQTNASTSATDIAFGTSYKFPGGIVPTISTTANKVDGTNLILPLHKVVSQLNTLMAEGTAINKVSNTKKAPRNGFNPVTNIWCAQTRKARMAIANKEPTIAR